MDATLWKNIVFNLIPSNLQGWVIYIGGFIAFYLWKKVGRSFVTNYIQAQKEKERQKELAQESRLVATENTIEKLIKYAIDVEHAKLLKIKRHCYRKGYRTDADTTNFEIVYHNYKALGGNTDGDDIRMDFLRLECVTVMEIRERKGVDNPSDSNTEKVAEFIRLLKSGVIADKDMNDIAKMIDERR